MSNSVFETAIKIRRPKEEVFDFFSKAENLEILTPEWLNFKIKTPLPIEMKEGTKIDYIIKLLKVPMKWRTNITVWEPPNEFQDSQTNGPYQTWIHTHTFETIPEGTLMKDKVEYRSKGWILAPLIEKLFVKKRVQRIFDYRENKLRELFN